MMNNQSTQEGAHSPAALPVLSLWQVVVAEDLAATENLIAEASTLEFPGLNEILKYVMLSPAPRWLAATALLTAQGDQAVTVADSRAKLAAGLEVLQGALRIHDLMVAGIGLVSPGGGANVLLGDTAFSRAALLVAGTQCPGAVALFSQMLGTLAEMRLHRLIERETPEAGTAGDLTLLALLDAPVLYAGAAEAGGLLVNVDQATCILYRQVGEALGRLVQARAGIEARGGASAMREITRVLSSLPPDPVAQGLLSLAEAIHQTEA